ncbi:uncharacterized protein EI90DRAFT_2921062 [Cantharellus anzutake]|uniref:uncharacterized protein n=1 Tax=Cantharellus anzutake TaxID=1750568 RepID=UPI001907B12E|nr:uncharacterized protein EI90DRAFT_2921062 [Cantharellus anzutake]KAF8331089.1 hypothetical protein EI90DRAFT_2921062 [Cantharellus anzutake]
MIEYEIHPDTETYSLILQLFAKGGYYDEAWALLGDMEAVGINPDKSCLDSMLSCAENVPEGIHPVLQTMHSLGITLDAVSYHHIISHHANFLNIPMCLRVLEEMQNQGIVPKIETADIIVSAASKAKMPKLALDVALLFEKQSTRKLEGRTWMKVLIASADMFYIEGVQIAWERAVVEGRFLPDEGTMNNVLNTAARHGLPQLARDVITHLQGIEVPVQEHHVAAMVDSLVAAGEIKHAFEAVHKYDPDTLVSTSRTMHSLFRAVSKDVESVDRAYGYLEEMANDPESKVNVLGLNVVIAAAVALEDMQRAMGIYKAASDFSVKPNVDTINTLLSGCILLSHRSLGDRIMTEARDDNIKPDTGTYERYIILCLTQPTYEDAFFYLEEMKGAGFKPTAKVYDSIIRRTLRAHDSRWKLAMAELLEAKYRLSPDLKALIDKHELTET